eukprot:TRINITY_DN4787_c0_g1_i1.p1 TRINITY_DN4787_c0_g1~~TRINITY_DN4787_c0_g1_i1.p1  ORF type:complete len:740 (-),score=173.13 TRINITY_DN4787_c0_g1_i1:40-2259(-)
MVEKNDHLEDKFPAEIYVAYNKIMSLARDLNTQIQIPEVVMIGKGAGAGRIGLMEAFLGFPLGELVNNSPDRRPLWFTLINNLDNQTPKFTIKRDSTLKEFDLDQEVTIENLPQEVKKRNSPASANIPVKIQIEYNRCWNMTLMESLPLKVAEGQSARPSSSPVLSSSLSSISLNQLTSFTQQTEEAVLTISRPSHRILVFVEDAGEWETQQSDMVLLAKKADPKLDRTVFVLTGLHQRLKDFTSSRDLNKFLGGVVTEVGQRTFFVTLQNQEERTQQNLRDGLRTLYQRDVAQLEQLQFDKRFERSIGPGNFRRLLLDITWRKYQETVPEVLKRLRSFRKNSEESLVKVRTQLENMDAYKLRALASSYVMEFLQSIEKLIVGTLEGNPAQNGQTLLEEKAQEDAGEWYDGSHRMIKFDPQSWGIPNFDSKLYGGQQFERLLAEFKLVAEHTIIESVTPHDIAAAAGPTRLASNPAGLAWTASDIVQKKLVSALMPLVEQLFRRSLYVLKRLVDIVDKMMDNKRKANLRRTAQSGPGNPMGAMGAGASSNNLNSASLNGQNQINIEDYPYFTHSVKEMYYRFVDQISTTCKAKCMDEFYCSRLLYWEVTQMSDKSGDLRRLLNANLGNSSGPDNQEAVCKTVHQLANYIFEDVKQRITRNILLKCYNFFLLPMQNALWGEVQGKITILSDQMLEELFEVSVTREKLKDDQRSLQQIMSQFQDQEQSFLEAANSFSHPIW